MSYRGGGYRGRGGVKRSEDSFRGRGGFKSKFGSSRFDDKPSFKERDRYGGGRSDRERDFRGSRMDDFQGDSGYRGSSPKRFRGGSGGYGGDRERNFRDYSPREDLRNELDSRSNFAPRKNRGGYGAPVRRGMRRGSSRREFSTKSGFISKRRDFSGKFSGASSRREYFERQSIRSRRDNELGDENKSDDEIMEDEEMEEEEYLEEEIEDEEAGDDPRDEKKSKDSESKGSDSKTTVSSTKKKESDKEGSKEEKKSDEKSSDKTSDDKAKVVKKKIVKKVVKKSDKDKEKKGDKDEGSDDESINLKCPHCNYQSSKVKAYLSHLKSKNHLRVMEDVMHDLKKKMLHIRIKQRRKQVFLDMNALERNLRFSTFNCIVCKLKYKSLKSEHQNSASHKTLKKILFPTCQVCHITFQTSLLYQSHICSVGHLKKRFKLEEQGKELPSDIIEIEDIDEDTEMDPDNFMVLDAAESGDEDKVEGENGEGKPKEFKPVNIGIEMCKKIEVYYCKLCDIHLTRPMGKPEDALTIHCRNRKHLEKYYTYQHQHKADSDKKDSDTKENVKKEKSEIKKEDGVDCKKEEEELEHEEEHDDTNLEEEDEYHEDSDTKENVKKEKSDIKNEEEEELEYEEEFDEEHDDKNLEEEEDEYQQMEDDDVEEEEETMEEDEDMTNDLDKEPHEEITEEQEDSHSTNGHKDDE